MKEFAPAKINLNLHVTGRRDDGFHLLDSLVVFLSVGDEIEVWPDEEISLYLRGPFAPALSQGSPSDNLVVKAAKLLRETAGIKQGARISLTKNLPLASGIGGGSADAAATLRALARLWNLQEDILPSLAGRLGSDVPACLHSRSLRMEGIGKKVTPLKLPLPGWFVLANPDVPVSTPEVFKLFDGQFSDPLQGNMEGKSTEAFRTILGGLRNDLEPPALALQPVIGSVLAAMVTLPGCELARMSGSGATCFALFDTPQAAQQAAVLLKRQHEGWWVAAAEMVEHANQA